jgi:hypothetical protein
MASRPLWESAWTIVNAIIRILDNDVTRHYKDDDRMQWQASGPGLGNHIESLKKVIETENNEFKVSIRGIINQSLLTAQVGSCYHYHLAKDKGRTIPNPAKSLIIVPLRGTSDIKLDAERDSIDILAPGTYWLFTVNPILIPKEPSGVDILVVAIGDEDKKKRTS